MNIEILSIVCVIIVAALMEFVDSGIGMGYGTVLTPLLLAFGFSVLELVPAILLSQALGGLVASFFHHRLKNTNFVPDLAQLKRLLYLGSPTGVLRSIRITLTADLKIVIALVALGVVAAIGGSVVAVHIPEWILRLYIGAMVIGIGFLLISGKTFTFSWPRLMLVGFLASFNKGFSGGGFGPISTGGQIVVGNRESSAIGCTTFAEAPICIIGFLTYASQGVTGSWQLTGALSVGSIIGALFGARLTKQLDPRRGKLLLGILIGGLGVFTLGKLVWKVL